MLLEDLKTKLFTLAGRKSLPSCTTADGGPNTSADYHFFAFTNGVLAVVGPDNGLSLSIDGPHRQLVAGLNIKPSSFTPGVLLITGESVRTQQPFEVAQEGFALGEIAQMCDQLRYDGLLVAFLRHLNEEKGWKGFFRFQGYESSAQPKVA